MKALIICDEKSVIEKLDKILCSWGLDTIIYNWLLKALDNIEEISPNFTIISVSDYPRHWKTLAQFINSGIARSSDKVILYTPKPLSSEEDKKAKALGVAGCFHSFEETDDGLKKLRELLEVKTSEKNNDSDADINSNCRISSVENIVAHKICNNADDENEHEIRKAPSEAEPTTDAPVPEKIIPDEDSVISETGAEQVESSNCTIQSVDSIAAIQSESEKEKEDAEVSAPDYKIPNVDFVAAAAKDSDSPVGFDSKIPDVDSVLPHKNEDSGSQRKSLLHKIRELYET